MYWYEEPVEDVSEPERAWSWKAIVGCEREAGAGKVEIKDQSESARSRRRRMSESFEGEQMLATSCTVGDVCVWALMLTLMLLINGSCLI